jgi:NAD(P)-dependent dehydrogenase (short-subunit alcohol dehydrogenase family)
MLFEKVHGFYVLDQTKVLQICYKVMEMKNIVVIGASKGIGRSLTEILLEQGHQVYATYCKNVPEFQHPNLHWQSFDATESQTLDLPEILHGLVYCPGNIALKPFNRFSTTDFAADYNLQVLGAIQSIQHAMAALKKSGAASLVLFSTVAVQQGLPFHSLVSASKGAIEGLTRALAAELAPQIRVNAIAPSLTNTPLAENLLNSDAKKEANAARHPLKRVGEPKDIAAMAAFLLSEQASWISGQILHVDGGISSLRV